MTKMFHVVLRLWDQRYHRNIIFTYHSNGLTDQIKDKECCNIATTHYVMIY